MRIDVFGSGSSGNCYALASDSEILLLDVGVKYKEILQGIDYQISDVVGVCVTHKHLDHAKYVKDFEKAGIPIFEPYKGGKQSARFGNFKVNAFTVPHDDTECRGFLIGYKSMKIAYMTDLEYCHYTFKSQKLHTLLVEANYSKDRISHEDAKRYHVLKGHCEIGQTLEIIKSNLTDNLQNVILCHLSAESADAEEFIAKVKEIVPASVNVDWARKGLSVELIDKNKCPFI